MIIKQYLDKSNSVYMEYDTESHELNVNDTIFLTKEPALTRIEELISMIKRQDDKE